MIKSVIDSDFRGISTGKETMNIEDINIRDSEFTFIWQTQKK